MAAAHCLALVFGILFILAGLVKLIPPSTWSSRVTGCPRWARISSGSSPCSRSEICSPSRHPPCTSRSSESTSCCFGALLAFGRPTYRVFSAVWLLGIMVGAFYTLITLGDPIPTTIPSVVFGAVLAFILLRRDDLYATGSKSKVH